MKLSSLVRSIAGGALWDATRSANAAFYPLLAFGAGALATAATLRFERPHAP